MSPFFLNMNIKFGVSLFHTVVRCSNLISLFDRSQRQKNIPPLARSPCRYARLHLDADARMYHSQKSACVTGLTCAKTKSEVICFIFLIARVCDNSYALLRVNHSHYCSLQGSCSQQNYKYLLPLYCTMMFQ